MAIPGPNSPSSDAEGSWTPKSPMPTPRNELAAAVVNGKIYVLGGNVRRGSNLSPIWDLASNEEYDPAADKWTSRAPLPSGASHIAAAVLDGKIYAIGGFIGRDHTAAVDVVFAYDPASDRWQALPPLRTPRGSVGAAALDGKVHAIGGRVTTAEGNWHFKGVVATHEVYDPATGKWTQAAPLPRARDHMVVVAVNGHVHVLGGRFAGNDDTVDWHDVYDPVRDSWISAAPLPTARGGVSGAPYKGMIMVIGGEDEKRTYIENEAYDLKADRWLKLAPLPRGRHGHAVAAVGEFVYVAGGDFGRGSSAENTTDRLIAFKWP